MSQSEFLAITFNLLLVYHPFFSSNHNYLHNNFSSSYTSSNDTVIRILTPNNYNVKVRLIIFIMLLSVEGAQKSEAWQSNSYIDRVLK